jgi:hypothetical protein
VEDLIATCYTSEDFNRTRSGDRGCDRAIPSADSRTYLIASRRLESLNRGKVGPAQEV